MEETAILSLDDARWASFVACRPESTAFHRAGWPRTLADAYGFTPFVLALLENGHVAAGAPMMAVGRGRSRRWISLPFTDVCPPLGEAASVSALLEDVARVRLRERLESIEIRAAVTVPSAHSVEAGVLHLLELDDGPSAARAHFSSQTRRNVGRAQREDVETSIEIHREAMSEVFYRLHLLTRRRQGVPVQPKRFFASLWEHVIAPGGGFIVVARVAGVPAAAAVFLDGNDTLTYKFGASDPEFLHVRPNHAVFWKAIEWACDRGRHTLDFGRTDLENTGLRDFKSSWGAREHPLVYTSVGKTAPHVTRYRARFLQPLISHSPTVVCRVIGEAFYRRAA